MRFSEVIGHSVLKSMLIKGVDDGRVSHAQLFSGASGYGTLALALAYSQYLNCQSKRGSDSCGVCPSCVKMNKCAHPDIHFIFPVNGDKSGGTKVLSRNFLSQWREIIGETGGYFSEQQWYDAIEIGNKQGMISRSEAEEIIKTLSFKSFEAEYKVILIWLPEKMNEATSNTLLKILEEPWDKTVFLMISEHPTQLIATIRSRVQEIMVGMIDQGSLFEEVLKEGVTRDRAEELSHVSCGDLVRARNYAQGKIDGESENFELFSQLMRLSYNDKHMELLEWSEVVAGLGREDKKSFFIYSIRLLRESYMMNAGMDTITYLYGDEQDFCKKFSPFIGNHNIEQLVAELELASKQIFQNGNPKIIIAHMALVISKYIIRV